MRHSVRARLLQTLVWAGCALALPASAPAAGGSPVHVDPASPVAKEYALPLATARGAAPESGKSGRLFGSGLKHASTAPTETATATAPVESPPPATVSEPTVTPVTTTPVIKRPHRRRQHRPPHVTTVTLPALTTPTTASKPITARATPAAYRVLRPGSGSGLLWMAIAAVLVIAVGSAGGLALRRRR
jgi:pyruvate/2-oxoglutarate dehydrogenase complex dihydrolipoamide acyltransferase (E2) component